MTDSMTTPEAAQYIAEKLRDEYGQDTLLVMSNEVVAALARQACAELLVTEDGVPVHIDIDDHGVMRIQCDLNTRWRVRQ